LLFGGIPSLHHEFAESCGRLSLRTKIFLHLDAGIDFLLQHDTRRNEEFPNLGLAQAAAGFPRRNAGGQNMVQLLLGEKAARLEDDSQGSDISGPSPIPLALLSELIQALEKRLTGNEVILEDALS
jgi:hypothetical protein